MMTDDPEKLIEEGFAIGASIAKKNAPSFYFVSRFLPADHRRDLCVLYGALRILDKDTDRAARLDRIRRNVACAYESEPLSDPLTAALRYVAQKNRIPKPFFDELVLGIEMDLTRARYENFDALCLYCYRTSGVAGLLIIKVLGSGEPEAERAACELGIALRLTSILRDIKEDRGRGRVYLPQDELKAYGITEQDIAEGRHDARFSDLMKFQITRARDFYSRGQAGLSSIADRKSRRLIEVLAGLHAQILKKIEQNNYNVFKHPCRLSPEETTLTALRLLGRRSP